MFSNKNGFSYCLRRLIVSSLALVIAGCVNFPGAKDRQDSGFVEVEAVAQSFTLSTDSMQQFCQSGSQQAAQLLTSTPVQRGQLQSICSVWYPGSEVPALPFGVDADAESFNGACERLWDAPESEREFLKLAFGMTSADSGAPVLCYFAMLDSDADGVLDFQVTDSGLFVENDIDVDGDHVPNVRDTNPLDGAIGEPLACGSAPLPPHLSSACLSGTAKACELQYKLFDEFDIVVLDRNTNTQPEVFEQSLQTVYDAANLVFKDGFAHHPGHRRSGCKGLWTMQTVAFEQCVVARKAPWDPDNFECTTEQEQSTEASAMAHNGLFTIYPAGAALPPVIQLGTYVHELAHLWQFAYDIRGVADTKELTQDNLWLVPKFEAVLRQWKWSMPKVSDYEVQEMKNSYVNLLPREVELTVHREEAVTWQGYTLQQHAEAVEYQGLVTSDENKELGNFGSYSLSNPWEWHADMFIAYLYRSLEQHVRNFTSVEVAGEFIAWFRAHVLDQYNNQFYHPNLKDEIFHTMQKRILPIRPEALDELLCRYLVNDPYTYSSLTNPSTFAFFSTDPPEHVQREILAEWREVCDGFK